jgi:hypothetical protein
VLASLQRGTLGFNLQNPLFYEGTGLPTDRYAKIGFETNDQYLLGPRSVGAYLFLNPGSSTDIRVEGNDSISVKRVEFGNTKAFNIPVTFQYRMTDYFGDGANGLGNVGGNPTSNSGTNLEYVKTIGIDIYHNPITKERFSFDLEVTARYYSKTLATKDIPTRSFETALDDLNRTIKNITPSTSRDVTSFQNNFSGAIRVQ